MKKSRADERAFLRKSKQEFPFSKIGLRKWQKRMLFQFPSFSPEFPPQDRGFLLPRKPSDLPCRKVGQMVFLAIKIPDPANFTERVRVPGGGELY